MEYEGMPHSWVEFYGPAFESVRRTYRLAVTDDQIAGAVDVLKSYNPRVKYRETEYLPEVIFREAVGGWNCTVAVNDIIDAFFASIRLTPYIYPETASVLERLKKDGHIVAAFTDVASGMPDELHKSYFSGLLPYFDLYVSSVSCGYRKPNPKGLLDIAEHFGLGNEDMIFIGDEKKDIVTAKRFGCRSVLIDRKNTRADFGQDFTIRQLEQLAELPDCFA